MKQITSVFVLKNHPKPFVFLTHPIRAKLYFKNYRTDLLTGKKESYGIDTFLDECSKIYFKESFKKPRVIHLFYELGFHFQNDLIPDDLPLAIDIEYSKITKVKNLTSGPLKIGKERGVEFLEYEKSFKNGYEQLLLGNCYQFNLTKKFQFNCDEQEPWPFLYHLWKSPDKRGQYAHATYLPSLNKLYLSNSPESLFEIYKEKDRMRLRTRPIKGTVSNKNGEESAWKELRNSKKDRAELNMITDLMRNDLSKIESPNSRILKKCSKLRVPGLLHQYSLIEVEFSYKVHMLDILSSLFPGGSITGAPKKRVMQILKDLESTPRGFYCGSSVLLYNDLICASINIRSAEVDLGRKLTYGSGGGITLLSECSKEFQEMIHKKESFISLFNN